MKYFTNSKLLVTFICVHLVQHASSAPQGWTQPRFNSTAGVATQNRKTGSWQANGGWNSLQQQQQPSQWPRRNQTVGNQNYYKPNSTRGAYNNNWERGNGSYQPQGERVWLNSNQSHPFIQVPGFRNPSNIFAAAKQPNRSISEGAGWRQPNNWSTQNRNATQWYPAARPSNNFTYGGQLTPSGASWAAPVSLAGNTNGHGGGSNSSRSGYTGVPAVNQWNSTASNPVWNARLPGNALVAGVSGANRTAPAAPFGSNAFNGQGWNIPNNPSPYGSVNSGSNSDAQLAPLAGHTNTGMSYANGSQQQSQSRGPYNTNPYANLFV
ncbi:uncharacterized protein LOC101454471 [Ceratitis capitata]|uniref:(Mediterranean fruit fly) hypothetical protein n=1 Tax=Ceratitis capitata TaxID=7213 RepID=A0A811V1I7_CERCA|nr:uncharacterized protein LOC101454471 [Ceratitis capitata]CAD7003726.1 unnamed protein product [Ceratitis capitata]